MVEINTITKTFETATSSVPVLKGVSLNLTEGESAAILGPSGSGKSTFLHILGALEAPTSGTVLINGQEPFKLAEPDLAAFRNKVIGFIFQDHHLLPQYSVLENVLLPTLACAKSTAPFESRAKELLEKVGLAHRLSHRPAELSGGEKQRVAIARALINEPALLLCDEPTGNLDAKSAEIVADVLFERHESASNILVVVTHSLELAQRFKKRFLFNGGVLVTA